jgi:Protein of unknown function DUF262
MLVDGQQRVVTLMLLVAALRDTIGDTDVVIAGRSRTVLLHPTLAGGTRLGLRKEGADELDNIVFGRPLPGVAVEVSHLRENYDFFLEAIQSDALAVWEGVQKLEHVAITLQEHANPQQVFESLNSTRSPLRNHELIHNYVLMGLTYAQQIVIEDSFWIPIEENTGDAIDNFLRDYLILKTGRDSEFRGEHGVYDVFRKQFPRPTFETLTEQAAEWKTYSAVYRIFLSIRSEWPTKRSVGNSATSTRSARRCTRFCSGSTTTTSSRRSTGARCSGSWNSSSRFTCARWWSPRAGIISLRNCAGSGDSTGIRSARSPERLRLMSASARP